MPNSFCNGPEIGEADQDKKEASVLKRARAILGKGPEIMLNLDPRGYALKIDTEIAKNLDIHKDMGGYGIICPEY
jgi:microcystin degradation protein MlrC